MAPRKTAASAAKTVAPSSDIIISRTGIMTIPQIDIHKLQVLIIGTAPLIVHKFSEKAIAAIENKQQGKASKGREPKIPHEVFMAARHRIDEETDGFPSGGLKACIVSGFDKNAGVAKTVGKGALLVLADDESQNLIRIITPFEPQMRFDMARNATGVVDTRYRPEYHPWAMLLRIEYIPQKVSAHQVLQAIAMAGRTVGLGEWRPGSRQSLSGTFGTFRMAEQHEAEAFEDGRLFADYRRPAALAAE